MKIISYLFIAVFVMGFMFVALPDKALSQNTCCQGIGIEPCGQSEFCCNDISPIFSQQECLDDGGILTTGSCNELTGLCSGFSNRENVPTLSEWGLIFLAGVLGIVGFVMVRRNKKATA